MRNIVTSHEESLVDTAKTGVRAFNVLCAQTAWVNGGTALHFCARAMKRKAVKVLLQLERDQRLGSGEENMKEGANKRPGNENEYSFDVFESDMMRVKDFEGNTPLICAALATKDNTSIVHELFKDSLNLPKRERMQLLHHKNLLELTSITSANIEGHLGTWRALLQCDFYRQWDVQTEGDWLDIQELRGVRQSCLMLLDKYAFLARTAEAQACDQFELQCKGLYKSAQSYMIFDHRRWPISAEVGDTLWAIFLRALQVGFYSYCEDFLTDEGDAVSGPFNWDGGRSILKEVLKSITYARKDVNGNNVLHLYVLGAASAISNDKSHRGAGASEVQGASEKVGELLLDVLKEVGTLKQHAHAFNLQGHTPFMLAVQQRVPRHAWDLLLPLQQSNACQIVQYFYHYSAELRTTENIMHWYACSQPMIPASSWLIPENVRDLVNVKTLEGYTPLELALISGHTSACMWLLKSGYVDTSIIEVSTDFRYNVFHMYAQGMAGLEAGWALLEAFEVQTVRHMINNRADRSRFEMTPLMLALTNNNMNACKLLLANVQEYSIRVSLEDKDLLGNNLLHCWCWGGCTDEEIWQMLTLGDREHEVAAHINDLSKPAIPDGSLCTPFMLGLEKKNTKACLWLLRRRPDIALTRMYGDDDSVDDGAPNVFHAFGYGGCTDKSLWKALITAHIVKKSSCTVDHGSTFTISNCGCDFSLLNRALNSRYFKLTPFANALRSGSEPTILLFLREVPAECNLDAMCNDGLALLVAGGNVFRSIKVWSELIRRRRASCSKASSSSWHRIKLNVLQSLITAASKGTLEVLDMLLQTVEEDKLSGKVLNLVNVNGESLVGAAASCSSEDAPARLQLFSRHKEIDMSMHLACDSQDTFRQFLGERTDSSSGSALFVAARVQSVSTCAWILDKRNPPPSEDELKTALWLVLTIADNRNYNDEGLHRIALSKMFLQRLRGDENQYLYSHERKHARSLLHLVENPYVISFLLKTYPQLIMRNDKDNWYSPIFTSMSLCKLHSLIEYIVESEAMELEDALKLEWNNQTTTFLHMFINEFERVGKVIQWISKPHTMVDQEGETALHAACKGGYLSIIRLLLFANPELIDIPSSSGKFPFHVAANSGHVFIVKELLECHPSTSQTLLDRRDEDGRTALHFAAACAEHQNALKITRILLETAKKRVEDNYTKSDEYALLLWASAGPAIGMAVDVASNADVKNYLHEKMEEVCSSNPQLDLVEEAAKTGDWAMVKELISRGFSTTTLYESFSEVFKSHILDTTKEADRPTANDSLGRRKLAKGVAALLLNPFTAVPVNVGVFAPWGMGKSSIMLQIEIILMMTIIQRNLLGSSQPQGSTPLSTEKVEISNEMKALQKHIIHESQKLAKRSIAPSSAKHMAGIINPIMRKSQLQTHTNKDFIRHHVGQMFRFFSPTCLRERRGAAQGQRIPLDDDDFCDTQNFVRSFVNYFDPKLLHLYKGLALMEKVGYSTINSAHENIANRMPSFLLVRYNAWAYYGESEASTALVLSIMNEIEASMTTATWLRLCWKCAYRMDPIFMVTRFLLPFLLCVTVGGWVLWLVWKLMSIPNNNFLEEFKYGSIPVSMVVVTWIVLRNVINIVRPLSEDLIQSFHTKKGLVDKLGYQKKLIDQIKVFQEEMCKPAGQIWKALGRLWAVVLENKDYIAGTRIAKAPASREKMRIVVFIDDLDRCSSQDYVLGLLTTINLILSVCEINVVLGVDRRFIQMAIRKVYKDEEAETKFLEKIIQIPVDLYDPSEPEMSRFLNELLTSDMQRMDGSFSSSSIASSSWFRDRSSAMSVMKSQSMPTSGYHRFCTNNLRVDSCDGNPTCEITQTDSLGKETNVAVLEIPHDGELSSRTQLHHDLAGVDVNNLRKQDPMEPSSSKAAKEITSSEGYVVEFLTLVSNYNEVEIKAFTYLHAKARGDYRHPRNWKRLLHYHRLAWSILSQSHCTEVKNLHGWHRQLIVWVFSCYNWKDQMNDIFENWYKLTRDLRDKVEEEKIHEKANNIISKPFSFSLHSIIKLRISQLEQQWNKQLEKEEDELKRHQLYELKREWQNLEKTINGIYDVGIDGIMIFQKFRFHCDVGYLHWKE